MGQRLKQGSEAIRDASNRTGSLIRSQVQNASNQALMAKNNISKQIKNNVGALNSQVGMARHQMQQAIGNANIQVGMAKQHMQQAMSMYDPVAFPAGFH